MAIFRPFRALRPQRSLAAETVAPPYDVMDRAEAKAMAEGRPFSFLRVTRSEICLPDETDSYSEAVYAKAKENLEALIENGRFYREKEPVYLIYRQTMGGREQIGAVGCVSIDEYESGTVRRHEMTRVEKEEDRIRHFDVCDANTEPVFLAFRRNDSLRAALREWVLSHEADFDFVAEDGVGHAVWTVGDKEGVGRLEALFRETPVLYIADGHHRSASAYRTGMMRRAANPGSGGDEEFNFFMAVAFPEEELAIYDYNRVVKDLGGMTADAFVAALGGSFVVEPAGGGPCRPSRPHEFGMYLGRSWYRLTARDEAVPKDDIIGALDVSVLQDRLFRPILGIEDPRTDSRLGFVGGIRGLAELERLVDEEGMAAAFALYPVPVGTLLDVADAGLIMPPKSTWFEPKLGSGLFVHEL
ncbi:MAG: DUF1015 family protein [Clostridiales Family XIII bacterium]|jgi:uncharacterized protein (DUF1015 family)|nr:DUF1015 family protein [Clostridiales Family XIII bacterium]